MYATMCEGENVLKLYSVIITVMQLWLNLVCMLRCIHGCTGVSQGHHG